MIRAVPLGLPGPDGSWTLSRGASLTAYAASLIRTKARQLCRTAVRRVSRLLPSILSDEDFKGAGHLSAGGIADAQAHRRPLHTEVGGTAHFSTPAAVAVIPGGPDTNSIFALPALDSARTGYSYARPFTANGGADATNK